MPRRKNPATTFLMFLVLVAAGWLSYKYLYVERIFASDLVEAPPAGKEADIRKAIAEAFANDMCYDGISSMVWRGKEFRWRLDVNVPDMCRGQAKEMARRISDVVRSASGGSHANVFVYAVGQEVGRWVP